MQPVIVVGAGLAGLTAAAKLARAHVPVVVLELAASPGGRARASDRDGYLLNLGPHALATRGPGTAVLRELGIELPGRSPTIARARFLRGDRVVAALGRRHGGAGLRAGPAVMRFMRAARTAAPDTTVAELIERVTDDAATVAVLRALARLMTYTDTLGEQSASVVAEVSVGGWVRYLDGGWGALVDQLRTAVQTAGAELRSTAPVRAIAAGADVVAPRVHLEDGEVVDASAVIVATGGPGEVARLVDDTARRHLDAWTAAAAPVRMACLDVALRRRPKLPSIVLGAERPVYLSVQSDRSRIAPPGGAVVQLARYLGIGERAPDGTRDELEAMLDLVADRWRDEVVHARFLPDMVVTHDAVLAGGGGLRRRPGPEVPGTPGLFVAGDWVGPRGYLAQAALASGGAAADLAGSYALGVSTGRQQPLEADV